MDAEFQRGYQVGMAVMRSYIADWLRQGNAFLSDSVSELPDPKFEPSGFTTSTLSFEIGEQNTVDGKVYVCVDKG